MAEPPLARLVHASPGRLRLRLPALRGDADRLGALALAVAGIPGVRAAEGRAETGSLLILHRGEAAAVLAAGAALFRLEETPAAPPPPPPAVLLPAAGAAVAALLAVGQALRGQALPPALTLGAYAFALAERAARAARGAEGPAAD